MFVVAVHHIKGRLSPQSVPMKDVESDEKAAWLAPKQAERGEAPCALFTLPNVAIAMSYFSVGAVMSLQLTPTNLYLVRQLDAAPTAQTTIVILLQVPWALKLVFGFMSDAVPIWGMHRKPYLVFGMFLYSGMYMLYGFAGRDSFQFLCFCVFFATLGLIMMDVMADTMVVERYEQPLALFQRAYLYPHSPAHSLTLRSKFEPESLRGQMQATCYSMRFAGGVFGALLAIALTSHATTTQHGLVEVLRL